MAGVEVGRIDLADLIEHDFIGLQNVVDEGIQVTRISVVRTLADLAFGSVMNEVADRSTGWLSGGIDERIARLPRTGFLEPVNGFVTLDLVPIGTYRTVRNFTAIPEAAWSRTPLACQALTFLKYEP